MKADDLFEAIGNSDNKYLVESEQNGKKLHPYLKWGALAACLCFAVLCTTLLRQIPNVDPPVVLPPDTTPHVPDTDVIVPPFTDAPATEAHETNPSNIENPTDNLPIITLGLTLLENAGGNWGDGGGQGTYMLYNISELCSNNPWTSTAEIDSMPVFESHSDTYGFAITGKTEAEYKADVDRIADFFGSYVTNYDVKTIGDSLANCEKYGLPADEIHVVIGTMDLGKIYIYANGNYGIRFNDAVEIPNEYKFIRYGTPENSTLDYLISTYGELLGFENPTGYIFSIYNYYGEINRNEYYIYDSGSTLEEAMWGYALKTSDFSYDDNGNLTSIIVRNSLSTLDIVGVYPIISIERATELLLNGFCRSAFDKIPARNKIAYVELVYKEFSEYRDHQIVPYYRFYIESDSEPLENGLKNYYAYYVPAIPEKYIKEMPIIIDDPNVKLP